MTTLSRIFLCTLFPILSALASDSDLARRIIPTPQEVKPGAGNFRITTSARIILGSGLANGDRSAADRLNDELALFGKERLQVVSEEGLRKVSAGNIYIASPTSDYARKLLSQQPGTLTAQMRSEGYWLDATPDGIVIIAENPRGRFYGVMSLVQLMRMEKRALTVPAVQIRDWPQQSIRGITDDISRGQISTVENFKAIIRRCARYKLNMYSPYIEDVFAFKNHPAIADGRGALTAKEWRELDEYARLFHVEMVPIFETLGHWENILRLKDYAHLGEFPGAHTVYGSDERVYALLEEMIGEIAGAFRSPWFNMAADESWDVGLGTNKERVAASDLATVHADHYTRLFDILKKFKKKPLMYGDVILNHPEILEKIPKEVVIVDWHYGAAEDYTSPETFKAAGFPFVVSPAVSNYIGPFPNYLNTFANIQNLTRDGYRNGALGVLTSSWNDHGGEAFRELNTLGYAWTSECAWQPERAGIDGFMLRFFGDYLGNDEAALYASSVYTILSEPANQTGWFDLWRHPMLPPRPNPLNLQWRIQSIENSMAIAESLVTFGRRASERNTDHWDLLGYVIRLDRWYGSKLRNGEAVRTMTMSIPEGIDADSVRAVAATMCRSVVQEFEAFRGEFAPLWKRTNKPEGLENILQRHSRQMHYWNEKIAELNSGTAWTDPSIPSRWIAHPAGNPGTRDSSADQVRQAFFTVELDLPKVVSAKLQLLGDTRARAWLNGHEVGSVAARRSLSLLVEYERSKIFDMLPWAVEGRNVLAVECESNNRNASAGFNVFAEFRAANDSVIQVLSDSTWNATSMKPDGWPLRGLQPGRDSINARSYTYPVAVIRPNLRSGRTSWFER